MPQMSPLMWANLFLVFSLLLLFSFIKIYFSNSKNLQISKIKETENSKNILNWMW